MPIVDSGKNRIISSLTDFEIRKKAEEIRFYSNLAAYISGTADFDKHNALINIAAVLYFNYVSHDPMNPFWDKRDRVFWSDAELTPVIYSILGLCGYFPIEELLRSNDNISGFNRFPDRFKVPGIEVSVDYPGSGLGVAVGDALSARMDNDPYQVFCIMSGREQSLGSVWEAADAAAGYKLDNLTAIVELQDLRYDCESSETAFGILADKYASFGWQVFTADSCDPGDIIRILEVDRKKKNIPAVIITEKYNDSCSSFSSDLAASLSGTIFENNSFVKKLLNHYVEGKQYKDINISESDKNPDNNIENEPGCQLTYSKQYGWNCGDLMKADFLSPENAFADFIRKSEEDGRYVFYSRKSYAAVLEKLYPDLNEIIKTDENMILTSSGLAKEGKIPFLISGGFYTAEKNHDQLRNTVCLNNFNVKFIDLYNELSVQGSIAYNISAALSIHNLSVFSPSDTVETENILKSAAEIYGPVLVRIYCGVLPVVTSPNFFCKAGCAAVIRYRGEKEKFRDAFETVPGEDYSDEHEDIAIITFSRMLSETMRSAYILKEEFGIEARILSICSVVPLDETSILNAASETGAVLVAGENSYDGFTDIIAASVMKNSGCNADVIFCSSVNERSKESNTETEINAELSAEYITEKAMELLHRKDNKKEK